MVSADAVERAEAEPEAVQEEKVAQGREDQRAGNQQEGAGGQKNTSGSAMQEPVAIGHSCQGRRNRNMLALRAVLPSTAMMFKSVDQKHATSRRMWPTGTCVLHCTQSRRPGPVATRPQLLVGPDGSPSIFMAGRTKGLPRLLVVKVCRRLVFSRVDTPFSSSTLQHPDVTHTAERGTPRPQ